MRVVTSSLVGLNQMCYMYMYIGVWLYIFNIIAAAAADHSLFGIQSGKTTLDVYAGGMVYDSKKNMLYVVGTSVDPTTDEEVDCFVSNIKLPESNSSAEADWIYTAQIGIGSMRETCFSAVAASSQINKLFIVGTSEREGLLTNESQLISCNTEEPFMYGTVLDVDVTDMASPAFPTYKGRQRLNISPVQYPVAAAIAPNGGSHVFVASMVANEGSLSPRSNPESVKFPYFEYGQGYSVLIQKLELDTAGNTESLRPVWNQQFLTTDGEDVFVSALLQVTDEILLFAGSTKGYGSEFGANAKSIDDFDGFITKVRTSNGTVPIPVGETSSGEKYTATYSHRINSQTLQDDFILGMCHYENSVYIVGKTKGLMDPNHDSTLHDKSGNHAFIAKMDIDNLRVEWSRQVAARTQQGGKIISGDVEGIACAVTKDGEHIFMAGTVSDGAFLNPLPGSDASTHISNGGDDIFLSYFNTKDGDLLFSRQIGSSKDDRLAYGGGLTVDNEGNAILCGDTTGSLTRLRNDADSSAEVFALSVSNIGDYNIVETPTESTPNTAKPNSETNRFATGSLIAVILGMITFVLLIVALVTWVRKGAKQCEDDAESIGWPVPPMD